MLSPSAPRSATVTTRTIPIASDSYQWPQKELLLQVKQCSGLGLNSHALRWLCHKQRGSEQQERAFATSMARVLEPSCCLVSEPGVPLAQRKTPSTRPQWAVKCWAILRAELCFDLTPLVAVRMTQEGPNRESSNKGTDENALGALRPTTATLSTTAGPKQEPPQQDPCSSGTPSP